MSAPTPPPNVYVFEHPDHELRITLSYRAGEFLGYTPHCSCGWWGSGPSRIMDDAILEHRHTHLEKFRP